LWVDKALTTPIFKCHVSSIKLTATASSEEVQQPFGEEFSTTDIEDNTPVASPSTPIKRLEKTGQR